MDADTPIVNDDSARASAGGALRETIDIARTVAVALAAAVLLRILVFQPFTIPSESMLPNLMVGDYLIVTKYDYGYSRHAIPFSPKLFKGRLFGRDPQRGDIVVFKDTKDTKTDYIKRLIGLPGDRIRVADGIVYLNGHALPQQMLPTVSLEQYSGITESREALPNGRRYVVKDMTSSGAGDNIAEMRVPVGHYFFMGDNRDNSADSRFMKEGGDGIGFVPAENLIGRARFILFSWEGAKLYNPVSWFSRARPERFFKGLH